MCGSIPVSQNYPETKRSVTVSYTHLDVYKRQVEHCVLTKMEQQDIHKVINQLNSEERMIIYGIFFENKTQTQMAEIMGISRQMLSYKLKSTLNKMREMYMNKFF